MTTYNSRTFARASEVSLLVCTLVYTLAAAPATQAQHVDSRSGFIYVTNESGVEKRLTASGRDAQPSLSANGDLVAYVRSWPSKEAGDERAISEIRIHSLATDADYPVLNGPITLDGSRYFEFGTPRFSPSARTVYFLFNWSVTTHGLASFDMDTKEVKFLAPAVSFPAVVMRGKYEGDLVVLQRRHKLVLGAYSLYYLLSPDGREVGVVGDTAFDVGLLLDPDGDLQ